MRAGRARPRSGRRAAAAVAAGRRSCTDRRWRRARTRRARGPRSRATGSKRTRFSASVFSAVQAKTTSPGRLPSARRPRASCRRISSASRPTPAAKPKRRPFARPSEIRRVRPSASRARRGDGLARQAERPRQHARPPSRDEAEHGLRPDAVEHFVEAAVAREDDHPVCVRVPRELGGVPGPLGEERLVGAEGLRDLLRELGRHPARVRVDDQRRPHRAILARRLARVGGAPRPRARSGHPASRGTRRPGPRTNRSPRAAGTAGT